MFQIRQWFTMFIEFYLVGSEVGLGTATKKVRSRSGPKCFRSTNTADISNNLVEVDLRDGVQMLLEGSLHKVTGQIWPVGKFPQDLQDGGRGFRRLGVDTFLSNMSHESDELLPDSVP